MKALSGHGNRVGLAGGLVAAIVGSILALAVLATPARAGDCRSEFYCQSGTWPVNIAIKVKWTDTLLMLWRGPVCDVDLNGNSIPGGPMDRARCVQAWIRGAIGQVPGPARNRIGEALHRREWRDLDEALWNTLHRRPECLTVSIPSQVDAIYEIGARPGDCVDYAFNVCKYEYNWTTRNPSGTTCQ